MWDFSPTYSHDRKIVSPKLCLRFDDQESVKSSLQEAITTGVVPLNGHASSPGEVLARPAIDELPALIWIGGVDQRVTRFNSRWLQFTGCTLKQALEGGWLGGVHPEDAAQRGAAIDTAWETRAPFEMEYRLRRADGEYRWMLDHGAPRYGAGGEFQGYAGVAVDITERKRSENELRWLTKAVEQSPASVMITDLHGKIEYVNPKFTSLTGYTLDEAVGQNPRILKSGETPAGEYRRLWETVETGEWRGEFHNRKKNGELYWESASISPIRDAHGRPTHLIAVKEDITDRKRMEAELRAAEERLRVAVENAQLYVYEVDTKTGAVRTYGSDDKFLSSLRSSGDWTRAIHPDDRERTLAAHRQRLEGGPAVQLGYRLVDPDGNVRHFADHGASERDGRLIGVLEDVTKARQAEEAQARLAAIVECSSNAIFSLDAQGMVRTWNAAAEKLYGYTAAEILGRPGLELSPPEGREVSARNVAVVTAGQPFRPFETEHMRKDGVVFPINLAASPIWDSQGKPSGCSVIVRDITEQKRADQALMESQNRFRALVQNSNDVITLTDPAGVILYDSPGVFDLLGVTPEQRIGRNALETIHPDDLANLRVPRESLRGNGSRWRAQLRLRHADGSWRWCDCWASNLIDEPGVNAFVVSCRDIRELKQAETALRESEERFRGLIEDATDIIFTTDLAGNFTSVNSMGERISGYTRQEVTGTNILQYAVPECHETIVRNVMALASGEDPPAVEVELIARDGHRVFLEVSGRLQLRDGVPAGLLGIARDIGQRKRVERLEQHRREVLEMVAQNQPLETVLCRVQEMIEHYYPGVVARIWATEGSGAPECGCLKYPAAAPGDRGRFAVPIVAGNGQVFGSLQVSRFAPWQTGECDNVLLDSMAKLASIAIEHRQLTQRLAYQAQHDSLTGLPNRSLLEDRLQQAIHLARRQSRLVAVLYVDLDRFKFINDTLGHHVGDLLLEESGKRLAGAVRGSDTLARTGGDEFVAVLSSIETEHDAEIVGERILEAMRTPFMVRGHELFVSASVGLSFFPQDGEDAGQLAKARRCGHVRSQESRQKSIPALCALHDLGFQRTSGNRKPTASGARPRRTRVVLSTPISAALAPPGWRGGAAAVEPSEVGSGAPQPVHTGGRRQRADYSHQLMGPAGGLPAAPGVAARRASSGEGRGEHLRHAVCAFQPGGVDRRGAGGL